MTSAERVVEPVVESVVAVFVAYATQELDLGWIPPTVPVIIVHNDRCLDPSATNHPGVRHVVSPGNIGFGAAVNLALRHITSDRVVVCNPDIEFQPEHWALLSGGMADEIRTVQLVDRLGRSTWVVNPYPTPGSLLLTAYRLGRALSRWPGLRRRSAALLGAWGAEHAKLRTVDAGAWPLATHWVSGAAFSMDMGRLRAVGGFDDGYFLYFEDVDLCARLAARFPAMRVTVVRSAPAVHAVGGSVVSRRAQRVVDRHYLSSCRRYAGARQGAAWRVCSALLCPRRVWLSVAW